MTRDDIIRMAMEATQDAPREDWNSTAWVFGNEAIERFATAAYEKGAAAGREECAKMAEAHSCGFCVSDLAEAIRARGTK